MTSQDETHLETALLTYFREQLGDTGSVEIDDLSNITDGWETELYTMRLVAEGVPDHEKDLVVRIHSGEYAKNSVHRESAVIRRLYRIGYPVPRIFSTEETGSVIGRPFIVMERIHGSPMVNEMLSADEKRQNELWSDLTDLLVRLHRLDIAHFTPDVLSKPIADYEHSLVALVSGIDRRTRKNNIAFAHPVVQWLKKNVKQVQPQPFSVIHNDFHPGNILVQEDGHYKVIDWTGSRIADYRTDIAWLSMLAMAHAAPELRLVPVRHYETATGKTVEDLCFFEVMALLRRLHDLWEDFGSDATSSIGRHEGALNSMREQKQSFVRVYERMTEILGHDLPEIWTVIDSM